MLVSLLVFSAPILLVIADTLLPLAFLTVTLPPAMLSSHFSNYDFRRSLIDVPLVSIARSAIIFCVYSLVRGYRRAYLAITAVCSVASMPFVSLKTSYVFLIGGSYARSSGGGYASSVETTMFVSSTSLGIACLLVAYRTSCKERRKLLVYKIDIEAWGKRSFFVISCDGSFTRRLNLPMVGVIGCLAMQSLKPSARQLVSFLKIQEFMNYFSSCIRKAVRCKA